MCPLPTVRTAAEKWRNGLAALVTLVSTGILLTGSTTASDLTTPWRVAPTAVTSAGLAAAVYGLVQCLGAEARGPTKVELAEVRRRHGSVAAFDVAAAEGATQRLRPGRRAGLPALGLIGAAGAVPVG